jgi:hypothetical protein
LLRFARNDGVATIVVFATAKMIAIIFASPSRRRKLRARSVARSAFPALHAVA